MDVLYDHEHSLLTTVSDKLQLQLRPKRLTLQSNDLASFEAALSLKLGGLGLRSLCHRSICILLRYCLVFTVPAADSERRNSS